MGDLHFELWNKLCGDVSAQKESRVPESKFQALFEDLLAALGWVRFIGEIDPQRTIPIGAANQIKPDIIIQSGNVDLFVVELKRPSVDATERHGSQLRSYMLQMKLPFGVYFGENCQVYYDDPVDSTPPKRIATIEFEPGSIDGQELLHLLSKGVFSQESAREYCDAKLAEMRTREQAEGVVTYLLSSEGKEEVASLILTSLLEQHGKEVASLVIREVDIEIKRRLRATQEQPAANGPGMRIKKTFGNWVIPSDTLSELKVGKIAQTLLRKALEEEKASNEEISLLRSKSYSKEVFGIDHPLLVLTDEEFDSQRYYKQPLAINGMQYRLCSQWFETSQNNDRPFLLAWLDDHGAI